MIFKLNYKIHISIFSVKGENHLSFIIIAISGIFLYAVYIFCLYLYVDHMKSQEKTGWGRISSACNKQKDSRVLILYPKHMLFQRSIINLLVSVNRCLTKHWVIIPCKSSPAVKKGEAKNAQVIDFGVWSQPKDTVWLAKKAFSVL